MTQEQALVNMLVDASGDNEPAAEDVALAMAAQTWLLNHGWDSHWRMGFLSSSDGLAFRADDGAEPGLVLIRRSHGVWSHNGDFYRVPTFRQALNQLAVLGILPQTYSTLGRDALQEHAEACERAAELLEEGARGNVGWPHHPSFGVELEAKAEGLREAANGARRFYRARVSV